MNIAIIPARAGSKRIPKKNIKPFLGRPIIEYSIEIAMKSNLFDKVVVSTDDDDIARVAIGQGAEVPFIRPKELSDDFSGTHEVVGHAVKWLEDNGRKIDYVCCIYATAPFIQIDDLKKGFELIQTDKWDSIIAATNFSYPVFRSFHKIDSGGIKMLFPEHYTTRSQDLPEVFHDAGQFYWASSKVWKEKPKGFNERSSIVHLPNWRVQDIDTLDDWIRAERIYESLQP